MFVIATIFAMIGVIVCIAGHLGAGSAADGADEFNPEWALEEKAGGTFTPSATASSYQIMISSDDYANCDTILAATTVKAGTANKNVDWDTWYTPCSGTAPAAEDWSQKRKVKLRIMTKFNVETEMGNKLDHTVTTTSKVWVVDPVEVFSAALGSVGSAAGGVMAGGALFIGGIIIQSIGWCLCCVACCCMCTNDAAPQGGPGGPIVVGAPVKGGSE